MLGKIAFEDNENERKELNAISLNMYKETEIDFKRRKN